MSYPVIIVVGHVPWWVPVAAVAAALLGIVVGTALEQFFEAIGRGLDLVHSKLAERRAKPRRSGPGYWIGYSIARASHRLFGWQWTRFDDATRVARRTRKSLGYRAGYVSARKVYSAFRSHRALPR